MRIHPVLLAWASCVPLLPAMADPVAQQVYLKASNTGIADRFGTSVAISGNTAVVGAPDESSDATGVDGNPFNEFAPESGAAYVFVRNGTTWTQQAYLKASNTGEGDHFGWSVAISGDTIVIGAHLEDSATTAVNGGETDNSASAAGAVYVFTRSGTDWTQQAYLKASNAQASDLFGSAVAISGDTIAVGANREDSSATGVSGDGANNAANMSGAAYVFTRSGTDWTQQAYLKPSDTSAGAEFGSSVGVAGDTVIVGSPLASAYTGSAYIFSRSGALWTQQAKLTAPNAAADARFGYSVAISGDTVVAGARGEASAATGVNGNPYDSSAPNAGAAYVFARAGATWTQQAYLKATNTGADDSFGKAVSIDGDLLVVGAFGEDSAATGVDGNPTSNTAGSSGAAYVYSRSVGVWHPAGYLKASNTEAGDWFGGAVAVSGDTVFAGAARESGAATGVNGAQSGNGAAASGAAYGYIVPPPGPPEIVVEQPAGPALADGAGTVIYLPSATGAGMAKSFTVRNTGSGPLIITDYVFGGTNPGNFTVDTSVMPGAIHPGLQGTLRVYFTGPSAGSYSATLQMISNDADESPFDIALSASAQSAASLYNGWTTAAGLGGGAAGKEAVPFNDGVENVMKYAFNMNGGGADTRSLGTTGGIAGLPLFYAAVSGGQPVFRAEYLRRKGSGVIYTPMVSSTLLAGSFVPMTGTTSLTDIDGQWERVWLDQPRNPATTTRGFGYLVVTLP